MSEAAKNASESGPTRPRSGSFGGITRGAAAAAMRPGGESASGSDGLRAVRRRWVSGVAVVLTVDGEGFRGATVSAFTVVSLQPPLVLICLEEMARLTSLLPAAGVFSVSLLDRRQEALAERFAARAPLPDGRLSGIDYQLAASGCPVLTGAISWLDCQVSAIYPGGDHQIVVGEVITAGLGPVAYDPLLTYEGSYRGLDFE